MRQGTTLLTNPAHDGEACTELSFEPFGMSTIALEKRLDVLRTQIEPLVKGETALGADAAMRLSTFFDITVEF